MNKIQYAVLYTSFLLIANVLYANETKFGELNKFKFGDMKKMTISNNFFSVPNTVFFDQNGEEITLQEFQGRVTLVNFWATWCAPCRKEMPSLATLSNQLGSDTFQILTIATMRSSSEAIDNFFDENKIVNLPTILLDKNGYEIGRLIGDADWSKSATIDFIKKAVEIDNTH